MNKATILVVDDEPQISKLLDITLTGQGYKVVVANTGREGLLMAASHRPDLILLDLMLPDTNGHDLLRELRRWYEKGIIMLSVQSDEENIVRALDNGASDYLSKPFRTAELLARIRSSLRRNTGQEASHLLQSGELQIDLSTRVASLRGEVLKLTATEFNLLALFMRYSNRVLTHHFILKEIWGTGFQSETQYLRVFVATLRKKLDTEKARIVTENGIGYRFVD